jgi:outer membrane lipoprotein-sorting protein
LTEAVFWTSIPDDAPVLFEADEEPGARYYVLTLLRGAGDGAASGSSTDWKIVRKVWFDRADLSVARLQVYNPAGDVTADVRYSHWDKFDDARFAREVALTRPGEDYGLSITIKKLAANQPIPADRFVLQQPPGTELVDVGAEPKEPQP